MAKRGRPRKPRVVVEVGGDPDMPAILGPVGRAEWSRITELLREIGVLAAIDRAMITAYCEAWEEFVLMAREVRKRGVSVETSDGGAKSAPWLMAKNAAADRLQKTAAAMGLSPASREKLKDRPGAHKPDALQKFLGGGAA